MEKKKYNAPKFKEVNVEVENLLQTISGGEASCVQVCTSQCLTDCSEDV